MKMKKEKSFYNICIVCAKKHKDGVLVDGCKLDFDGLYDCFICNDCIRILYDFQKDCTIGSYVKFDKEWKE